jgi:phage-related minor tail protein
LREGAASLAGTINSTLGDSIVNLATNFGNAQQIGLNFLQTLADGFKQLANTIIQELTRAFVNQAVSKIFGFALSFVPGLGSFSGGAGFGQQTQLPSGVGIGAGNGIIQNPGGQGFGTLGPNFGFRQFAQGGVVTGPTLGLVGEGRFNEAVVPLPDGRRIPVDLGGNTGNNISTNIVVNVNNGQASSQVNGSNGQAFGRELEGAVRSVILKESRPGGIIYSQR